MVIDFLEPGFHSRGMRTITCFILFLALAAVQAQPAKNRKARPNPLAPIEDVEGLPRVLVIGDSISIGYTLPARGALKGRANLHRPSANCGPTTRGLASLDDWLGDGDWDVIHFNWGLHDLKYMNDKGQLTAVGEGRQQVPLDQYEKNLDALVVRLKETGAKLIWRNTTPVPEGARGRVPEDVAKYNEAAARVMEKHGVPTHDLHAWCLPRLDKIQRKADVHFVPDGSEALGQEVAKVIIDALRE